MSNKKVVLIHSAVRGETVVHVVDEETTKEDILEDLFEGCVPQPDFDEFEMVNVQPLTDDDVEMMKAILVLGGADLFIVLGKIAQTALDSFRK